MKYLNKALLFIVGLGNFNVVVGFLLSSSIVSADDSVVDEINITVPVSCTLSGTGMDTHNANINNGLYVPDIGTTSLHVFCNDAEGFAIYAAGYTGNEVGGTNSNKLVGTTASGNATIESGTATAAGNPDISNWAMKLAISQDSGDATGTNAFTIDSAPNVDFPSQAEQSATQASFSQYHVVPNEYTKVAHKNSNTDMTESTGGVKLTTTYAAYISKTQAADTYSGQVIYALVHPASSDPSQLTPPTSCTTPVPGLKYMQDLTSSNKASVLASMTEDAQYYLGDKRDNKTYCVSKLRDGNIWMTQNLDHDIVTTPNYYTNHNTDIGWNSSTNSYDETSWTAPTATSTDEYNYDDLIREVSLDAGDYYWDGSTQSTMSIIENGNSHFHIGNYYNWPAALAVDDAYYYDYDSELGDWDYSEYNKFGQEQYDIDRSICPSGWTLPKGGTNFTGPGSFKYLLDSYGWNSDTELLDGYDILEEPLAFNLTDDGERYLDGGDYVGHFGFYWSSVVGYVGDGCGLANMLSFDLTSRAHEDSGVTMRELSVRCVAR